MFSSIGNFNACNKMNKSKDFLVDRLNMISDSLFWPNYSVRKNLSFLKLRGKVKTQRSFVGKIKNLAEKRELQFGKEKKLVGGLKIEKKRRVLNFDLSQKRQFLKNEFNSDEHIKVLRVVPSDKIVLKGLRKSREGLSIRSPKYEDPKIRMRSCVAQTDEISSYFHYKVLI